MSNQPPPYSRQFNFEDYQTLNPTAPLPGEKVEAELNGARSSINQTISRLNEIQNADGSLKTPAALAAETTATATAVATTVAESATQAYLSANYDPTIAAQAAASADGAEADRIITGSYQQSAQANAYAAEQQAQFAQTQASQASTARQQAQDHAAAANTSKLETAALAVAVEADFNEVAAVYAASLSLKNWVDSESFQFLHKREDMADAGAIMMFNDGEADNTLIGKVFQGASVSLDSSVVYRPPTSGTSVGNMDIFSGPWWVEGHDSPEDPHKIVMRDMMSCLVDTWTTFGPRVGSWSGGVGNIKPRQNGINGQPNTSAHIGPERIKGVNYSKDNFGIGLYQGSSPLTPKSYVDDADLALGVRIDGKANTVHTHIIGNVTGLQTALDGKSATTHSHIISDITGLQTTIDGKLSLSGGAMSHNAFITMTESTNDSELAGWGLGVELTSDTTQGTTVEYNGLHTYGNGSFITVNPTGITFPDSTVQTTAWTGTGGSFLPLAGGTMTGNITFDGTSGQYIGKGSFDTSRGGNFGISLMCSIGYEFNWQAGWLKTTEQGSSAGRSLYLDCDAGTTLKAWSIASNHGVEIRADAIVFPDSTVQTTASNSAWQVQSVTNSHYMSGAPATSGPFNFTYFDNWTQSQSTVELRIEAPSDGFNYDGYNVNFDDAAPYASFSVNHPSKTVIIGLNGYATMQEAVSALNYGIGSGGWILYGNGSPYASASVLTGASRTVYGVQVNANGKSFVIREGFIETFNEVIKNNNYFDRLIGTDAGGKMYFYDKSLYAESADVAYKSGTTFTGKVNLAAPTANTASLNLGVGTSPTTSVAGDIWISTNINFKANDGVFKLVANTNTTNTFTQPQIISSTTTSAALRITQLGTGEAFRVEDSTSPDSTSFIVSNDGNVGIGYSSLTEPTTANLAIKGRTGIARCLNIDATVNGYGIGLFGMSGVMAMNVQNGYINCDGGGIKLGYYGSIISQVKAPVAGTGTYDKEIEISIGGNAYRIPCRQV